MRQPLSQNDEGEIHTMWDARKRAIELLDLVAAEWKSDPMSVQCFDRRIVQETHAVLARLKVLEAKYATF